MSRNKKAKPEQQRLAYELYESGLTWAEVGEKLGINSEAARASARRYKGVAPEQGIKKQGTINDAIRKLADHNGLSDGELKAILVSARHKPNKPRSHKPKRTKRIKILAIADTHIGEKKFKDELFTKAVADSKEVDVVLHAGDHLEGMSGRPGHIYELRHVGYQAQKTEAVNLYSAINKPIYGIDGNHDQWFKQKNNAGVVVGEELEVSLKNYTHLGEWEGDFHVDNLWIKLFHANDGTSYANSYKGQKLVESLTGGEKPNIILQGHYHKMLYQFTRNVHLFDCGTICGQTRFMRGKKLAAHMGYWILDIKYNSHGVERIISEMIPWYE